MIEAFIPFAVSSSYKKYVEALLLHESFCSDSNPDDDQINYITEMMEGLWDKLDEGQQESLRGLSSDLNWISRDGELAPKSPSKESITDADIETLRQAERSRNWHSILHALRACAPRLTKVHLAKRRIECYSKLGLYEFASETQQLLDRLENQSSEVFYQSAYSFRSPFERHYLPSFDRVVVRSEQQVENGTDGHQWIVVDPKRTREETLWPIPI